MLCPAYLSTCRPASATPSTCSIQVCSPIPRRLPSAMRAATLFRDQAMRWSISGCIAGSLCRRANQWSSVGKHSTHSTIPTSEFPIPTPIQARSSAPRLLRGSHAECSLPYDLIFSRKAEQGAFAAAFLQRFYEFIAETAPTRADNEGMLATETQRERFHRPSPTAKNLERKCIRPVPLAINLLYVVEPAVAALCLICLSPFLVILALAIRAASGASPLVAHRRVGLYGKALWVYKF